jgi:2-keto-4-pentenoate hydratase
MRDVLAKELLTAEETMTPVAPITARIPELTIEEAYGIQLAGVNEKLKAGRRIVGKKIGLTSKAMQKMLGVDVPDYGHLLDDMLVADGETCPRERLILPRVEGEIAFVLKDSLRGPGVTAADVLRATEGVRASIEVIDSRIKDWKIGLPDTIADNASSARFVLGSKMLPVDDLDLRLIGMVMEKNGEVVATGAGAAVWGHPAASVAWLANCLSAYGIELKAGEVILSGAVTAALDAVAGDVFDVTFDRLGLVRLQFV